MPMQWNSQAEAQLLAAIIQVYDIKVASAKLKDVAALMGPDCTAKAVSHQLAKYRQLAKPHPLQSSTEEAFSDNRKSKATKASAGKEKGSGKQAAAARTPSPGGKKDDDDESGTASTPPRSSRPRRNSGKKRNYAKLAGEDETNVDGVEDRLSKKMKIGVREALGEGLRQPIEFEDKMGELEVVDDVAELA